MALLNPFLLKLVDFFKFDMDEHNIVVSRHGLRTLKLSLALIVDLLCVTSSVNL